MTGWKKPRYTLAAWKKPRYIWLVKIDGEPVKAFHECVPMLRFMKCLNDCGIAMARLDWEKTIQFASGRLCDVLSYVCVF